MNIAKRSSLIRPLLCLAALLGGLLVLVLLVSPTLASPAASYNVNTLDDNTVNGDGFCTLREAVLAANNAASNDCGTASGSDETITFSVDGTINLASTLPNIAAGTGTLTIDGGGDILLSGDSDGNLTADVRALIVDAGATLTLRNLTIIYSRADTLISGLYLGGGIFSQGNLTATNVTFRFNSADYGGAIYTDSTATLERCTFSANTADTSGGAIDNVGTLNIANSTFGTNTASQAGGAILNFGSLTINQAFFYGNSADYGGGIHNSNTGMVADTFFNDDTAHLDGGGIYNASGSLSVTRSTFSGEHANATITGGGGGIYNAATLNVINSTFTQCQAANAGGGIFNADQVTLTNSTFSNNYAGVNGGGFYNTSAASLANTILANSSGGGDCVSGGAVFGNNNLVEDNINACGLTDGVGGNIVGQDPQLAPLAQSGPLLYPLLAGSPAIDSGDNSVCPATDQRSMPRPQDGDQNGIAVCDIGSYEALFQVFMPLVMR